MTCAATALTLTYRCEIHAGGREVDSVLSDKCEFRGRFSNCKRAGEARRTSKGVTNLKGVSEIMMIAHITFVIQDIYFFFIIWLLALIDK